MEHGMTQQAQAKKRAPRLEVTNPNAAGIDIGSASHYAPMATPNCSTVGQSNCSRQDGVIMRGLR